MKYVLLISVPPGTTTAGRAYHIEFQNLAAAQKAMAFYQYHNYFCQIITDSPTGI